MVRGEVGARDKRPRENQHSSLLFSINLPDSLKDHREMDCLDTIRDARIQIARLPSPRNLYLARKGLVFPTGHHRPLIAPFIKVIDVK